LIKLNPEYIKIPSAVNNNFELIKYVASNYSGDIHVSTGMTSKNDRFELVKFLSHWPNRVVIYHCTTIYPCPFEKLHLLEIEEFCSLKKIGMRVGFSNHGYGIAADIAAWVLGAEYIERHFTDDRTIRHTDAAASLEPDGLGKLCRDLHNVSKSMTYMPDDLDSEEIEQSKKLRFK
jgi:N-acetylneuraminate synthase